MKDNSMVSILLCCIVWSQIDIVSSPHNHRHNCNRPDMFPVHSLHIRKSHYPQLFVMKQDEAMVRYSSLYHVYPDRNSPVQLIMFPLYGNILVIPVKEVNVRR